MDLWELGKPLIASMLGDSQRRVERGQRTLWK